MKNMESIPYKHAIGSLMYLMVSTRPDIASSIQVFSKYMENPGIEHWQGVKRVKRYLKSSMGLCLTLEQPWVQYWSRVQFWTPKFVFFDRT